VTIPGGIPPQLLSDWKSAEERLYPVVMVRPDLYVAARHTSAPDSPESAAHWFRQALTSVLGTPFDAK